MRCLSTVIQTYSYIHSMNGVRASFSTFLYFILLFWIVKHLRDDRHSQLVCTNRIVEIVSLLMKIGKHKAKLTLTAWIVRQYDVLFMKYTLKKWNEMRKGQMYREVANMHFWWLIVNFLSRYEKCIRKRFQHITEATTSCFETGTCCIAVAMLIWIIHLRE